MKRNILFAFIAAGLAGIPACDTIENEDVAIEYRETEELVDLGDEETVEMDETVSIIVKFEDDAGGFSITEEDLEPVLVWDFDAEECELDADGLRTCTVDGFPPGAYSVEFYEVEGKRTPYSTLLVLDEPGLEETLFAYYMPVSTLTSKDLFFAHPNADGELISPARLVPAVENHEVIGWKVYGLRDGHPMLEFGVRNGDIITAFNEEPIGSISELMELGADEVPVMGLSVIRHGEEIELVSD